MPEDLQMKIKEVVDLFLDEIKHQLETKKMTPAELKDVADVIYTIFKAYSL